MFDATELSILATALEAEADFLRAADRHGVPTVRQLARIAALKAKIADLIDAEAKKGASATKEVQP